MFWQRQWPFPIQPLLKPPAHIFHVARSNRASAEVLRLSCVKYLFSVSAQSHRAPSLTALFELPSPLSLLIQTSFSSFCSTYCTHLKFLSPSSVASFFLCISRPECLFRWVEELYSWYVIYDWLQTSIPPIHTSGDDPSRVCDAQNSVPLSSCHTSLNASSSCLSF